LKMIRLTSLALSFALVSTLRQAPQRTRSTSGSSKKGRRKNGSISRETSTRYGCKTLSKGGTDRAPTARALLRGKSLMSFEASIEEARRNDDGEDVAPFPIDVAMVDTALTAVATTAFPHRALEIQCLWMNRGMRKPHELTTRKTAAAITRINNALPLFPGGTEASEFSNAEVIGLLKWSLPPSWRSKFNLDGYIPALDMKAKLIENCEAIERNPTDTQQAKPTHKVLEEWELREN
jgi:hypothetical protein